MSVTDQDAVLRLGVNDLAGAFDDHADKGFSFVARDVKQLPLHDAVGDPADVIHGLY